MPSANLKAGMLQRRNIVSNNASKRNTRGAREPFTLESSRGRIGMTEADLGKVLKIGFINEIIIFCAAGDRVCKSFENQFPDSQ